MKNTDLYKGFGEIDDELVERAQAEAEKTIKVLPEKERKEVKVKKFNWKKISKYAGGVVAACLVVGLGSSLLFGRMGKAASSYDMSAAAEAPSEAYYDNGTGYKYATEEAAMDYDAAYGTNSGYTEESKSSNIALSNEGIKNKNVKLIYTADLQLQTLEFAETEKQLYELVEKFDGYVENTYQNNGGMYYQNYNRDGSYTFRIPQEHYTEFINSVGEGCHVVSINQSVEDITLQYSDVEKRLATLNTKYDRLLDLLSKADNMSDIIDLENAISECEYQIDNYSSTKTRYDSLVSYSTVSVYLTEVDRLEDPVEVDNSFFARLGRNFKNGFENALDNLLDFFYWFAYNIIGIVIFAVIVIVVVKFLKKHPIKRKNRIE